LADNNFQFKTNNKHKLIKIKFQQKSTNLSNYNIFI